MPAFKVNHGGNTLTTVQLAVPGEHNILNALAAFTCGHTLGVDAETIRETLEGYRGTQRRFDIVGMTSEGVKIVDDYAHHPTEIKATLDASQNVPHNNLWCIFQPHTYTRTMALFDEFADAEVRHAGCHDLRRSVGRLADAARAGHECAAETVIAR